MSRLPLQRTRFNRFQQQAGSSLFSNWGGSWRRRSLAILALLMGIYAGSNVFSLWLLSLGSRPLLVLLLVLALELIVRLRSRLVGDSVPLGWVVVDNLRIGLVYSVVLESFKLGS
ncbi:MAG: DUF565 domain-containing protein [Prochlorococcaceae cyanobacterium]